MSYVLCVMIGATIGFFTAILCVAAKDKSDEMDNDNEDITPIINKDNTPILTNMNNMEVDFTGVINENCWVFKSIEKEDK